jgi:hypothetical protein
VAGDEPRDAPRERLERQRDVHRARDDAEDGVAGLELLDLIERRAVRPFLLEQELREPAQPHRGEDVASASITIQAATTWTSTAGRRGMPPAAIQIPPWRMANATSRPQMAASAARL